MALHVELREPGSNAPTGTPANPLSVALSAGGEELSGLATEVTLDIAADYLLAIKTAAEDESPVAVRGAAALSTTAVLTSSTAAADLLAAPGAGVRRDIVSLTLVNSSATGTVVEVYEEGDAVLRWVGYVPPTDMRGIVFSQALEAGDANEKWRWKTMTSVASVTATAQYRDEAVGA